MDTYYVTLNQALGPIENNERIEIKGCTTKEGNAALVSLHVRERKWWDRALVKPDAKPNKTLELPDVIWKGIRGWASRTRLRGDSEGPTTLYLPRLGWSVVSGGVLVRTRRRHKQELDRKSTQYAIILVEDTSQLNMERTLWIETGHD